LNFARIIREKKVFFNRRGKSQEPKLIHDRKQSPKWSDGDLTSIPHELERKKAL
jgi:hypothetical protein